ncbi:MAG: hypothetical protein ACREHF_10380 [Rhizomicrobium sp.]
MAEMNINRHATSIGLFPGDAASSTKTAIVFGVARGGTSMVAGAIRGLGFYMGHALENNNEDLEFSYKSLDHMKQVIRRRDVQHRKWGWKFPAAANYLDDLLPHIRNPHLIIVNRDLAATSAGHVRWHQREATFAISDILLQSQKNFLLALRWRMPALMVSYEKATQRPGRFIEELSQFLGEPVEVDREKLVAYLGPGKYKKFEDIVGEQKPVNAPPDIGEPRARTPAEA